MNQVLPVDSGRALGTSPPSEARQAIGALLLEILKLNTSSFLAADELVPLVSGKFLRSGVAYSTFESLASNESNRIRYVAAVVELSHLATLLHDDVLDNHLLRRLAPTFHARFGAKASILLGDLVVTRALAVLADLRNPDLVAILSESLSSVFAGELDQHLTPSIVDIKTYLARVEKKTGALFGAAAAMGALLATDNHLTSRQAYAVGNLIGTAYQIFDDYRDYFGSQAQGERRLGEDVRTGIMTLPVILLEEKLPGCWSGAQSLLHNHGNLEDAIGSLRASMAHSGIPTAVLSLIRNTLSDAAALSADFAGPGTPLLKLVEAYSSYFEGSIYQRELT